MRAAADHAKLDLAPRLFRRLRDPLDLRDEVQFECLLATADALLARSDDPATLDQLEWMAHASPERWSVAASVVVKLARSKRAIARRPGPLHLSVVVPLYAEHERMQRPGCHQNGEAFLDRKLRQLDWLLGRRRGASYDLCLVDDGCPYDSGRLAESWLAARHPRADARVLFLEDAIAAGAAPVRDLEHVDQSQKGGSIHLGLHAVTQKRRPGHVVVYTDADLSTHLGQSGLLVEALDRPGTLMAAGSRRHPLSVVEKGSDRSARGRLFIYLWKKLIPELAYIDDTQCGFKALSAGTARRLVAQPLRERGFAFDIELMLRAEKNLRRAVDSVPIAWVDSEPASTTTALEPYLQMLRGVVGLYRALCPRREASDRFAEAIDAMDDAAWAHAVEVLAPALEAVHPALDLGNTPLPASALVRVAA